MAVDTPIENPTAYDKITIDRVATPGRCTLKGGGDRKNIVDTQQAPGFMGAFNFVRGQEIPIIDYEVHVWTDEDYKALQELAARLVVARDARPPKTLALVDLALDHNKIGRVIVISVGAIQNPSNGKWFLPFTLKEDRKRKPIGGPVKPGAFDALQQRQEEALAQEQAQLQALKDQRAAQRAAESRGI
jgi:hypothetical protein